MGTSIAPGTPRTLYNSGDSDPHINFRCWAELRRIGRGARFLAGRVAPPKLRLLGWGLHLVAEADRARYEFGTRHNSHTFAFASGPIRLNFLPHPLLRSGNDGNLPFSDWLEPQVPPLGLKRARDDNTLRRDARSARLNRLLKNSLAPALCCRLKPTQMRK